MVVKVVKKDRNQKEDVKVDERNNYLVHHGVLGMKWGVRKDKRTSGSKAKELSNKITEKRLSRFSNKTEKYQNKSQKYNNKKTRYLERKSGKLDKLEYKLAENKMRKQASLGRNLGTQHEKEFVDPYRRTNKTLQSQVSKIQVKAMNYQIKANKYERKANKFIKKYEKLSTKKMKK